MVYLRLTESFNGHIGLTNSVRNASCPKQTLPPGVRAGAIRSSRNASGNSWRKAISATGTNCPRNGPLAESFGVSRSSVREAIRALAEKGLLESRQGDGTYVRVPDIEPLKEAILEAVDSEGLMFDEVTEYRRIVEPGIAEIAAVRHTSEQLDRLKIIACDQQRRLLVGENDGDLDARFHLALAECTGNKLLIDTVARLNRIYAKGRTPELRDTPWRQFSVSSHLRIIDALERRSPEDSRKALEEHIDTVIHKHLFATVRD